MWQVREQHIVKNEKEEARGEENAGILINYSNNDTVENKTYLKKLLS